LDPLEALSGEVDARLRGRVRQKHIAVSQVVRQLFLGGMKPVVSLIHHHADAQTLLAQLGHHPVDGIVLLAFAAHVPLVQHPRGHRLPSGDKDVPGPAARRGAVILQFPDPQCGELAAQETRGTQPANTLDETGQVRQLFPVRSHSREQQNFPVPMDFSCSLEQYSVICLHEATGRT